MSDPVQIALITQAGALAVALIAALGGVTAALIQTGRLKREQRQSREDREIAEATSDAQAVELALVEDSSPCSSPSCLRGEARTMPPKTLSPAPTGEPA